MRALEDLRKEFGDLAVINRKGADPFVFRRPDWDEWVKYANGLAGGKSAVVLASKQLVTACCVSDHEALSEFLKSRPASTMKIADALGSIAGRQVKLTELDEKVEGCLEDVRFSLRCPSEAEWVRYIDAVRKTEADTVPARDLAVACGGAEMSSLLSKYPAMAVRIADALGTLAGDDVEVSIEKN